MNYSKQSERYTVRDLATGLLRTDPDTGAAIMPGRAASLADAFTRALPAGTTGLQRVPVVSTGKPSPYGRLRFLCDCGRQTVVLYRPKSAERFACVRCAHISYAPPKSNDAAHRRYVQALIGTHGREAVIEMAKQGLSKRLGRARARDEPTRKTTAKTTAIPRLAK